MNVALDPTERLKQFMLNEQNASLKGKKVFVFIFMIHFARNLAVIS
jgi:hypothetical protein